MTAALTLLLAVCYSAPLGGAGVEVERLAGLAPIAAALACNGRDVPAVPRSDLTQDAFTVAWEKNRDAPKRYFILVAVRRLRAQLARDRKHWSGRLDGDALLAFERTAEAPGKVDELVIVLAAIERLRGIDRTILWHTLAGYNQTETAARVGLSPTRVGIRLARVRAVVRSLV